MKLFAASVAILMGLALTAYADGKVFSVAIEANPTTPYQRALIHYANDTERMVVETSFLGSGTNFAWVVPVPSVPKVEAVAGNVFPQLHEIFQPKIVHKVVPIFVFILVVATWIGIAAGLSKKGIVGVNSVGKWIFSVGLVVLTLMFLVIPSYVVPRGGFSSLQAQVKVLDRKMVGIYETATISSKNTSALMEWLNANGYASPTNIAPAVADYVRRGWVFVAAKVRREASVKEAATPHPLAFTFKTTQPVYPLRLTGIDNEPCRIDLYVFGPGRAEVPKFKVLRCSQPQYSAKTKSDTANREDTKPALSLQELVQSAPVATKLSAVLNSADMQTDAPISWVTFKPEKEIYYSHQGARTQAANIFVPVAILAVCLVRIRAKKCGLPIVQTFIAYGCVLALSAVGAGWFYWTQPKKEVRMVSRSYLYACVANLKQIDGAAQQWALEYKKTAKDAVTTNNVVEFLKGRILPVCPSGGAYNVTVVKDSPTCTVHGDPLSELDSPFVMKLSGD